MVFVDDEREFVKNIIADHYSDLLIDIYSNPYEFLKNADNYPKDTKIILDNNYHSGYDLLLPISGIMIAKELHEKGFTKLYLYSWETCDTPNYLTLILKTDLEKMANLDKL